jgi:hypothetical protein
MFGANCALVFFVLTYYGWGLHQTAEPDAWAGMLILAAVLMLADAPRSRNWAWTGGCIALATLVKPLFVVFLILPVLQQFKQAGYGTSRSRVLVVCMLAFVLVFGVAMLALAMLSGGLHDYTDVVKFTCTTYLSVRQFSSEFATVGSMLIQFGLLLPSLVATVGLCVMRRDGLGDQVRLLGTWLGLGVFVVIIQGRYWPYQWMPAVLAMAPSIGALASTLSLRLQRPGSDRLRTFIPLIIVCMSLFATPVCTSLAYSEMARSWGWPGYFLGFQTRERYLAGITGKSWNYLAMRKLSQYIAVNSKPVDTVLVWGWDPIINVLSDRKSPTRFGFSYPLIVDGPFLAKYRALFLKEVSGNPPRYVVVDTQDPWVFVGRSGLDLLNGFPEFNEFLQHRYAHLLSVDEFQLWVLIT